MALSIVDAVATIKRNVAECLTAESIHRACRAENHRWRERELGPVKTVHAFLLQVLHGNTACSHAVRLAGLDCTTEAYCQARRRLPLNLYQRLLAETSQAACQSWRLSRWHGHRTLFVDGSSFSMADTPELQASFGQPGQQTLGCGFPVARWWGLFEAQSGLLIKLFAAPLRTHDGSQLGKWHSELRPGDVVVADRGFTSYVHLALLSGKKLYGLFRLHQRQLVSFRRDRRLWVQRKHKVVVCQAKSRLIAKLGRYDQLVEYSKPVARPEWMSAEEFATLPEKLVVRELRYWTKVRGCRTRQITLVTTLLDPVRYPASDLAELYRRRWEIETCFAHLKTTMRMDVLHCRTVDGVLKELTMFGIVYNLVRVVMLAAACEQGVAARQISFVAALRWLALAEQHTAVPCLPLIPRRPYRYEPRVRKRRMKEYDLMKLPRKLLKQRLLRQHVRA
jgi:hypothetical protein